MPACGLRGNKKEPLSGRVPKKLRVGFLWYSVVLPLRDVVIKEKLPEWGTEAVIFNLTKIYEKNCFTLTLQRCSVISLTR